MGVPGEEKEFNTENIVKKIMTETFSNSVKHINLQFHKAEQSS